MQKYRETQTKVIDYILNKNPTFFVNFKNKITSNNANLVSEAINESVDQIKTYLRVESKTRNMELNKNLIENENNLDLSGYDDNLISGVGLWLLVTVLVVLFIVINVTIESTKTSGVPTAELNKGINSFSHQSLVIDILN